MFADRTMKLDLMLLLLFLSVRKTIRYSVEHEPKLDATNQKLCAGVQLPETQPRKESPAYFENLKLKHQPE